jgi:hypothetical protein
MTKKGPAAGGELHGSRVAYEYWAPRLLLQSLNLRMTVDCVEFSRLAALVNPSLSATATKLRSRLSGRDEV